jgi:hypothetical protein
MMAGMVEMMSTVIMISLIHLIQHPEVYHEKHVRFVAFASIQFERKALYISAEDYRAAITKNAIWLDIPVTEETGKLGHLKLYSGTLEQVSRIELWAPGPDR